MKSGRLLSILSSLVSLPEGEGESEDEGADGGEVGGEWATVRLPLGVVGEARQLLQFSDRVAVVSPPPRCGRSWRERLLLSRPCTSE
ncbi:hypothetical protein AQJ67_09000 [Streptomyces caeruleatus]|uniref:Uncharacterized protein n=1 Tax=Streptomyces caeruleatus TaxID=661399 RepID=A0A117RR98_9ACTN|nr:hypothetical protein AQJ67_09000 [Streptomyces caeruleatus]